MIRGVSVTVYTPSEGELDRFGNSTISYESQTVDNVLVAPGATADLEAARPEGATVSYTLHFPKTFSGSLEGALIALPDPWEGTYRVVGSPGQYMDENTPTQWHMPVEVGLANG